ncbi:restriction endonuclease subunit S [Vibrio parahaemolyticus]|uniref:restriction endonuclease subunit S n=1 Tax=Vibrio parahaemolyticus TaxID=670 RepID=UPI000C28C455|nr:restriction endonuclease subunit S [Vibrio parahaemolyticus]EIA1333618.1 restriction endonuclease subunit S [Vibrio parahaemolyticus]PJR18202.1 hypothetical protein CFG65_22950 [Vibrio parahaemolyticus]HAS6933507.1 hypothetical protein [Vibrio parahaemolyticus]HCE1997885.1 restriction endonuclease subunit S [Vibrio parahaemolyticus]HCG6734573.1 restriction endonuclease subunit S [Vibrio parahaemolyticus]
MSKLPLGWFSINTGSSFTQISTTKLKVKSKDTLDVGIYPVVDQGAEFIAGYVDDESKVIYVNNPLCIFGDHTRAIKWIDFDFVPGADGTKVLVPASYLFPKFFYYQLKSLEIEDRGYSRHFKYLKATNFKVAPLNEQIRIANKLDSILAKVDKAQARLDKIPAILKRFRQSVLAAATSGELTKEWRESKDLHWEVTSFGKLIKNGPQNGIYKPSKLYGSGTKIIRIDGFYDGKLSPWESIKSVQLENDELAKWKLKVDDILINRVNSIEYLGKCGHVDCLPEDAVFESNIMRVELDKSLANPLFIKHFLSSPIGLMRLRANAKHAVNQASINQTDVKSVEIQLPSIEEQKLIAELVEAFLDKANKVEKQYLEAKSRLDRLTQSILAKAFRGELVPQDPNDEPAEKLLERILAEKEQSKPKKTTRKRTTKAKTAEKE